MTLKLQPQKSFKVNYRVTRIVKKRQKFEHNETIDGHFYQGQRHFWGFRLLRYPPSFFESFPNMSLNFF